jgi:hypothetical protein
VTRRRSQAHSLPLATALSYRLAATTSHYRPYQLECPTCRAVAAFHEKADLLQPHLDRILPRPLPFHGPAGPPTPQQLLAADWSFAISSCLRRGMSFHARCGACTILMGPGHAEPGIGGFCRTHSETAPPNPLQAREPSGEVLSWIAGTGAHAAPIP